MKSLLPSGSSRLEHSVVREAMIKKNIGQHAFGNMTNMKTLTVHKDAALCSATD